MKTSILGSAVMAAFLCGSYGCNRTADESVVRNDSVITSDTYSATTTANDPATAPTTLDNSGAIPPTDTNAARTQNESVSATETKTSKKTMKKSKAHKKGQSHHGAWNNSTIEESNSSYSYNDGLLDTRSDDSVLVEDDAALYDDYGTISATTVAAPAWDDGGLSPYAHEPKSREDAYERNMELDRE